MNVGTAVYIVAVASVFAFTIAQMIPHVTRLYGGL